MSVIVVFLGLAFLIYMCYKGHSTVWAAPVAASIIALLSGMDLLKTYTGPFMQGLAGYITSYFPMFCLGAIYGKIMDMTGSARSLGDALIKLIGPKRAVLAVVLPCLLMTYGGISLFVVVFVIYPMGYAIYRRANLPRTLLPGAIAFGAFTITMTAIPGTPQIQNIIPTNYFGTTAMAAPMLSIIATVIVGGGGYAYLEWKARRVVKSGKVFEEDPKFIEVEQAAKPKWHWLAGLLPLIAVVIVLNVVPFPEGITALQKTVAALISGIVLACLLNINQWKILMPSFSEGAKGSLIAIMNTASEVGFGSVVKIAPGFAILTRGMLNMPGGILVSEAVAVNVLAGATGSASGGMSIALEALGKTFLERAQAVGMSPDYLHRIASLASGGMDTMPHNGAVLTLLAISNCTHKESYIDIFIVSLAIPVATSIILAIICGVMFGG